MRELAYRASFARFAGELPKIRPDHVARQCFWGGPCGSTLGAEGRSIPSGYSGRGADDRPSADDPESDEAQIALWGLLERDALAELRLLAAERPAAGGDDRPPNAPPPGARLAAAAEALTRDESLAAELSAAGLAETFPAAVRTVLDDETTRAAMAGAADPGDVLIPALARAFVAEATIRADEELGGTIALDGDRRDRAVAAVAARLGGTSRGLGGRLGRAGLAIALRLGVTQPVERRRAAITQAAAPAAGDVLMYLARGERIRGFIRQSVAEASDSGHRVVLLAHSLGGIASLELLATTSLPAVSHLITFGSQASHLYELNALPTLEFGAPLPETVPKWINIFDRRDLLSYVAEPIFPGRVTDREVDSRAPFPRSHSAYLAAPAFYRILNDVLP